jgi:hypothetical protein
VLGLLAGIPFASANPLPQSAIIRLVAAPTRADYSWVNRHGGTWAALRRSHEALFLSGQPIADSYPVLARAAQTLSTGCVLRGQWHHCRGVTEPHISVRALRKHIHISFLPNHAMVITATALNRWANARRTMTVVTDDYLFYLWNKGPAGHNPAMLYATLAAPGSRSTDVLKTSGIGALFGALIGVAIGAVVLIPRRRRLRIA